MTRNAQTLINQLDSPVGTDRRMAALALGSIKDPAVVPALLAHLKAREIGAGVHYPLALHLQPAMAYLGYGPGDFPQAEAASQEVLSLPLYPEMTAEQLEYVADAVLSFQPDA